MLQLKPQSVKIKKEPYIRLTQENSMEFPYQVRNVSGRENYSWKNYGKHQKRCGNII